VTTNYIKTNVGIYSIWGALPNTRVRRVKRQQQNIPNIRTRTPPLYARTNLVKRRRRRRRPINIIVSYARTILLRANLINLFRG